ncbi:MAG: hypothetical protein ACI4QH_04405 [Candidatus Fimimonas sp.]
MNLVAFAIVIVSLLALLLVASIVLLVLEKKLEKALVKNGHPADKCKRPVKSVSFKKKDTTVESK